MHVTPMIESESGEGTPDTSKRLEHRLKVIALAIVLLFLAGVYLACLSAPAIGLDHDDGIYAVTAKSMAEDGAYRIKSLPNTPLQTKYPPLFPLALSVVWRIFPKFPENGLALRCVPLLFCLLWLQVLYLYARAQWNFSPAKAWIIILFTAASPLTINTATTMFSDCAFGLFLILSLWLIESDATGLRDTILAALFATAAYYTRTAAISVIIACFFYLCYKRRFSRCAAFCAVVIPLCLVWTIWFPQPAVTSPIEAYYTRVNYHDWNLLANTRTIDAKLAVGFANALWLATYPVNISFAALQLAGPLLAVPLLAFAGSVFWMFAVHGARRAKQLRASHIAVVLYLGTILCWAWDPRRFINPVLPFLLIWIAQNRRFRGSRVIVSIAAVAALAGAFQLATTARTFQANWFSPYHDIEWRKMNMLYGWISRNSTANSIVMADHDPAVYLYTGRKAIRPFSPDTWQMFYGIKSPVEPKLRDLLATARRYGVGYLLVTVHDHGDDPDFPAVVETLQRSGAIETVYDAGPGVGSTLHYAVYRFQHY